MSKIEEITNVLKNRFKLYDNESEIQIKVYDYLIKELSSGNNISEQGYKYLCWLSFNNNLRFPSEINKPIIPITSELSVNEFRNRFCTNGKRKEIYAHFINYVKARIEQFQVASLNVLIGGSFVEESNNCPNDIDCTVLLDQATMNNFVVNDYDSYCVRNSMPIDVEFAIEDPTFKEFWYYSCLTHLGNKPDDKKSKYLKNNIFKDRRAFAITLTILSN